MLARLRIAQCYALFRYLDIVVPESAMGSSHYVAIARALEYQPTDQLILHCSKCDTLANDFCGFGCNYLSIVLLIISCLIHHVMFRMQLFEY